MSNKEKIKDNEVINNELKDLAEVQAEEVKPISAETVEAIEEQNGVVETASAPAAISFNGFGKAIANAYCVASDLVFKKIKKTDSAPAWDDSVKAEISEQVNACLAGYNIPVDKPIYALIVTLAMAETMRYTIQAKAPGIN